MQIKDSPIGAKMRTLDKLAYNDNFRHLFMQCPSRQAERESKFLEMNYLCWS